jgi:hypothetical protein
VSQLGYQHENKRYKRSNFAEDFVSLFKTSNWAVNFDPEWTLNIPGVFVAVAAGRPSVESELIVKALDAAKILYTKQLLDKGNRTIPNGFKSGVTYLAIGRKPHD